MREYIINPTRRMTIDQKIFNQTIFDHFSVNIGDRGSYDDVITPQPSGEPPFSPGNSAIEDNFEDASPVQKDHATSPTSESEFSAPTMNDDGFSHGILYMSTSTVDNSNTPLETTRRGSTLGAPTAEPTEATGASYVYAAASTSVQI
jgi:hypothetical protein